MFGKIVAGAASLFIGGTGVASAQELKYELVALDGTVKESRDVTLRLGSDFVKLESTDKAFLGAHRERLERESPVDSFRSTCQRLMNIATGIIKRDHYKPINEERLVLEGTFKVSGIWNGVMSVCEGELDGHGGLPDFNAGATSAGEHLGCTEHGTAISDEGTTYDVTGVGCD